MQESVELRDRQWNSKAAQSSHSQVNDEQGLGRVGKKQVLKVGDDPDLSSDRDLSQPKASIRLLVDFGLQLYRSGILGGHLVVRIPVMRGCCKC